MKSRKLTLRKEMLLGLSLLLILAGIFEFGGHLQMQTLTRQAALARQVSRCERLFDAVHYTNPVDPATGQVSNEWKTAKDNFLTSVSNLSQEKSLDQNAVADIQKAWQAYENATVPQRAAVKTVVAHTLHEADKAAQASLSSALATTDFGLRIAVLAGSLIGAGIVLFLAKDIRNRLGEARQQLQAVTQSHTFQTKATGEDELKLQADQLTKAVAELNDFIGQSVTENTPTETKQRQEEKISLN